MQNEEEAGFTRLQVPDVAHNEMHTDPRARKQSKGHGKPKSPNMQKHLLMGQGVDHDEVIRRLAEEMNRVQYTQSNSKSFENQYDDFAKRESARDSDQHLIEHMNFYKENSPDNILNRHQLEKVARYIASEESSSNNTHNQNKHELEDDQDTSYE